MSEYRDYILSDELLDLQAFAKDFANKELAPVVKECDEKGEFPMDVYKKFFDAGFATMFVPKEYGGEGTGAMEHVIVNEQFAKVDVGFIISATTAEFGSMPLTLAAEPELVKYYMGRVMEGQMGSFCLTEPDAGSDASATRTTAVKDGDEWVINGRKCFITSGGIAGMYTVFATTDRSLGHKGIACFLVERERPGVSVGHEEDKMGIRCSNTTDVIFEDVRIPAKNMVAPAGKGYKLAMTCLDRSRGVNSYGALGVAERALEEAVAYAKVRKTFGKPIIKHQGLQFLLSDMDIQTTAARHLLYHCAEMCDRGIYDPKLGAITKAFLGDTVMKVTTDAVQVLGGYGYSKEYPVEKLMRDAKIWQIFEGTNQIQRMVIGGNLNAGNL